MATTVSAPITTQSSPAGADASTAPAFRRASSSTASPGGVPGARLSSAWDTTTRNPGAMADISSA